MILVGLVSGGMDSATAFAKALNEFKPKKAIALTVIYGQRHKREIESAKAIARFYKAEHIILDLSNIFKIADASALLKGELPKAESIVPGLVPPTYVPQRNLVLLSSAAAVLEKHMIEFDETKGVISVGFHRTDYEPGEPVYPDTRPEFVEAVERAINEGSSIVFNAKKQGKEAYIKIYAPFIHRRKSDIVKTALELNVPLELTWTCYRGGERPCGRCPACYTRLRAFMEASVPDPLTDSYEDLPEWYREWLNKRGR
ncbi:queuosine biosynthesis protein QueC [Ignicoccus pacificus DSM 13166]|uniref:7-cyano-7-deazaguanine synthase n=1 Tax=Ignicoccus pacificus DSM 13166 TaxID=940294 RepID=A0A977K9I3_9CREN|nr:queuosine biosynthesis protein QueC [Ignicoccus pacificus DSM 13166]